MNYQNIALIGGILLIGSIYAFSTGLTDFKLSDKPSVEEFDFPLGANSSHITDKERIYDQHVSNLENFDTFSEKLETKFEAREESLGGLNMVLDSRVDRKSDLVVQDYRREVSNESGNQVTSGKEVIDASNNNYGFEDATVYQRDKKKNEEDYDYSVRESWYSTILYFERIRTGMDTVPVPVNELEFGSFQAIREKSGNYYARYGIRKSKIDAYDTKLSIEDGYILLGQNSSIKEMKVRYKYNNSDRQIEAKLNYQFSKEQGGIKAPEWIEKAKTASDKEFS